MGSQQSAVISSDESIEWIMKEPRSAWACTFGKSKALTRRSPFHDDSGILSNQLLASAGSVCDQWNNNEVVKRCGYFLLDFNTTQTVLLMTPTY